MVMWGMKTKSVNLNKDWNEQQLHGYEGDEDKIK